MSVSLVFGQAKVAPIRPTSIPRLELCAAVLSTKAVKKIRTELDLKIDDVKFYTDSKVVLGYISNDARRFHVYVANRVQVIRDTSEPHQWNYVDTSTNPADLATRGTTAKGLIESDWLEGPSFLKMNQSNEPSIDEAASPIIDDITINENDPDVKVNAYVTSSTRTRNGYEVKTVRTLLGLAKTSARGSLSHRQDKKPENKQRRTKP